MQNHTTRELITALQYLLIGLVSLLIVQQWFGQQPPLWQVIVWTMLTGTLSLIRLILLALSEWVHGNKWQKIRRRNWD
jgi:uncharacterized membrane protein YuzA (DUF378 family)